MLHLRRVGGPRINSERRQTATACCIDPSGYKAPFEKEDAAISDEAQDRKLRSIQILRRNRVPYIDDLPTIETETDSTRRSHVEVVGRTVAVMICALRAWEVNKPWDEVAAYVDDLTSRFDAETHFSPLERRFLCDESPSEEDASMFSNRWECMYVLLWALGLINELDRPTEVADIELLQELVADHIDGGTRSAVNLRPQADLLDAADLIYRYHWAVRYADIQGLKPPAKLHPAIVYYRHYALNWLVGYQQQNWDDVSTDT